MGCVLVAVIGVVVVINLPDQSPPVVKADQAPTIYTTGGPADLVTVVSTGARTNAEKQVIANQTVADLIKRGWPSNRDGKRDPRYIVVVTPAAANPVAVFRHPELETTGWEATPKPKPRKEPAPDIPEWASADTKSFASEPPPSKSKRKPTPPKKTKYELQNQKYTIFKVRDSSFGRVIARATIELHAPTAKTTEQQRDTVMMAATEYHMDGYTVAAVSARLWDSPKQRRLLARVKYLPNRCGWTGDDCDGSLWSDLVVGYEAASIPADLATWRGIYQGPKQYH